jgi:hypothetical protein
MELHGLYGERDLPTERFRFWFGHGLWRYRLGLCLRFGNLSRAVRLGN